ncbi:hypothetical protein HFK18_18770|uniref:hypothetical protein n=1 Tax=Stenotrophomonas sp. SbOxS2 TaxID=2723885 RepID=UPI0015D39C2C|nr:hypothetical protein [Stenotrophomonas sp. SbOxS2]NYU00517.1 hypothetical protein [Stenotrophomonas sp. SbOxS2]
MEKIALMGLLVWFSALDAIPDEATILNNVVGSEGGVSAHLHKRAAGFLVSKQGLALFALGFSPSDSL